MIDFKSDWTRLLTPHGTTKNTFAPLPWHTEGAQASDNEFRVRARREVSARPPRPEAGRPSQREGDESRTSAARAGFGYSTFFSVEFIIRCLVLFGILVAGASPLRVNAQAPDGAPSSPADRPSSHAVLPPDLPAAETPEFDSDAAQKIEQTLRGEEVPAAPGMLGDVLEMLRSQGSVLDGSVLDPRSADRAPSRSEKSPAASTCSAENNGSNRASGLAVAEALLRTARMLSTLPQNSNPAGQGSREQVVRQMRVQATRLLVQEFPDALE